jgi:hypothetical protein
VDAVNLRLDAINLGGEGGLDAIHLGGQGGEEGGELGVGGLVMVAADGDGGGGGGGGVVRLIGKTEEERLDRDTRLSRASVPKAAAPRLWSS